MSMKTNGVTAPGNPKTEMVLNTPGLTSGIFFWFVGKEGNLDAESLCSLHAVCKKLDTVWKQEVLPRLPIWQRGADGKPLQPLAKLTREVREDYAKRELGFAELESFFGQQQSCKEVAAAIAARYPNATAWRFISPHHPSPLVLKEGHWARLLETLAASKQVKTLTIVRCESAPEEGPAIDVFQTYPSVGERPELFGLIGKCAQLETFKYTHWCSKLSDASLGMLTNCRQLTHLDLTGADGYTPEGLKHLKALPRLTELRCGGEVGYGAREGHMAMAGELPHLTTVYFDRPSLIVDKLWGMERFFKAAGASGKLQELEVRVGNDFSSRLLTGMSQCPQLRVFKLSSFAIHNHQEWAREELFACMGRCPSLEVLDLAAKVAPKALESLPRHFPKLTSLGLGSVDDETAKALKVCSQLRALTFHSCDGFSDLSMPKVVEHCPDLEHLRIKQAGCLGMKGILEIARLPHLRTWSYEGALRSDYPTREDLALAFIKRNLITTVTFWDRPLTIQCSPGSLSRFLQLHCVRLVLLLERGDFLEFQTEMELLKRVSPEEHQRFKSRIVGSPGDQYAQCEYLRREAVLRQELLDIEEDLSRETIGIPYGNMELMKASTRQERIADLRSLHGVKMLQWMEETLNGKDPMAFAKLEELFKEKHPTLHNELQTLCAQSNNKRTALESLISKNKQLEAEINILCRRGVSRKEAIRHCTSRLEREVQAGKIVLKLWEQELSSPEPTRERKDGT